MRQQFIITFCFLSSFCYSGCIQSQNKESQNNQSQKEQSQKVQSKSDPIQLDQSQDNHSEDDQIATDQPQIDQPLNNQAAKNKLESFGDITSISKPDQSTWQQLKTNFSLSIGDLNSRITYNKNPISNTSKELNLQGWKGEEVNAELVISSKKEFSNVSVNISDLKSLNNNTIISKTQCRIGYVYYVIADNSRGVCHKQDNTSYDKIIMPDIIDFQSSTSFVKSYTNRPVWISMKIPSNTQPGLYKGKINALINGDNESVDVTLKVSAHEMPSPSNRKFFLNLWQYPIVEAEYYKVKPWSDNHFRLMRPAMQKLKQAGQRVITASFFWDEFNSKTRSADNMMIKVIKTKTGEWSYDFTNFDKWVNFMMGIGINKQIECFGMAPLNYRYYYLDENDNAVKFFSEGVNGKNYATFWKSYLKAFEQHLKEKNWFSITTLGIDEKEASVLSYLIQFIKSQNPDWKISFTGTYFPQLQNKVYDYSVISNLQLPDSVITGRNAKGYITTFYTSCWEKFPNTFVMSDPGDATWLAWNAANRNMNGYLRYAYDNWTPNILSDVRTTVASGDNFLIYPDGYSSVRFEMLKEGAEDFEKITLSKNQSNLKTATGIQQLKSTLSQFDFHKVNAQVNRYTQIQSARAALDK